MPRICGLRIRAVFQVIAVSNKTMSDYDNYSETKEISNDQMLLWLDKITQQTKEFNPDEIIPISRSGFSYGLWISQMLVLPMGGFWPDRDQIVINPNSKRVVFVDDCTLAGRTYLDIKKFMMKNHPDVDFRLAVLFSDYQTPTDILDEIFFGEVVDYYIATPFPGHMKKSIPGVRYREE